MEFLKKVIDIYKGTPIEVKGGVLGAVIAFMFFLLGFLKMMFLVFCIVVGIVIAKIVKGKKDVIIEFASNFLDKILPSSWRR